MDVTEFADGVYLVNLQTEDKQSVSKMVKVVKN
jgi:hypothetical protein